MFCPPGPRKRLTPTSWAFLVGWYHRGMNEIVYFGEFTSPVGGITLAAKGSAVYALHIEGDRYFTGPPQSWVRDPTHPVVQAAWLQLQDYLAGRRMTFDLPLAPQGTLFQQEVWAALRTIEPGTTVTYADIAAQVGRPGAARAVGTAIGRNPICIVVPCHRVLASGGKLGGYVAGLEFKQMLLDLEAARPGFGVSR